MKEFCTPARFNRDRVLLPMAVMSALWVLATARALIAVAAAGGPVLGSLLVRMPALAYWWVAAPAIIWLGLRFPLRRGIVLSLAVHAVAALAIASFYPTFLDWTSGQLWSAPAAPGQMALVEDWGARFQVGVFTYGFVMSWGYVHEYFTRVREREVALARVEAELAQAQLRALKAQLQPHFLFNTLHAITVLIRQNAEAATLMVMRLSDLLRMTLVDADRKEVPLERELGFLRLYLEIEQTRLRERLEVAWDIAAGVEHAAVPPLLLQPIVENALKHGIGTRASGGRISISARREDDRLQVRVHDNGAGLGGRDLHRLTPGIGLNSTRGRLERLYGVNQQFMLEEALGGGVGVTIEVPYRLADIEDGVHG